VIPELRGEAAAPPPLDLEGLVEDLPYRGDQPFPVLLGERGQRGERRDPGPVEDVTLRAIDALRSYGG
jgi:hypothetical protein